MSPTPDPRQTFPQFYANPHIIELGRPKLWTLSDGQKRPIDVVNALETTSLCNRCYRPECDQLHGAQLIEADSQLLTLDDLTAALPTLPNVATHLDFHASGFMVLDIEPRCPPEVTDQLLRLVTGNNAAGPVALYSELSCSSRGYHLLLPLPANLAEIPNINYRTKIQHPKRWYEVLLYHWITFSRNPIPTERLIQAQANSSGDNLTWEAVFAQLNTLAPGSGGPKPMGLYTVGKEALDELDAYEHEIATNIIEFYWRNEHLYKELSDFDHDTSRWEASRIQTINRMIYHNLLVRNEVNHRFISATHPRLPTRSQLANISYAVVTSVLPEREKHHTTRTGMPYLAKQTTALLESSNFVVEQN